MINILKRMNPALPGLVIGILFYGIIVWAAGIWFVPNKLMFSTGLSIGIGCACGMAVHIASVLAASVSQGEYSRRLSVLSVIRYFIVAAVLFIMMYFHLGDLLAAFVGILGLKISAYAQPKLENFMFFRKLTKSL